MTSPSRYELLQEHSPVGPSSSHRWLECPGSVLLTKDMPDTDSIYAAEGTFAHYVSELARRDNNPASKYIGLKSECGRFTVDKPFADAIQEFLNYVNQFHGDKFFEYRVSYDAWVPGGFGTADDINMSDNLCRITDLKFGTGVKVFAKEDPQLKLYALGVFQELGHLYDIDNFVLAIHQPRLDHIEEWEVSIQDILLWAENVIRPAAEIALRPDAPFKAGSHCRWCPAKGSCAHRARWVFANIIDEVDELDPKPSQPSLMSDEALGLAMDLVSLVRVWCKDVETQVISLVQKGKEVRGAAGLYKMVEGRSNRKWRNEEEAETALRETNLKVAQILPRKLITITNAEELLGKKHKIFKEQVVKPKGAPVIADADDSRSPVQADPKTELEDLDNV